MKVTVWAWSQANGDKPGTTGGFNGVAVKALLSLGYQLGFYGHHDWWTIADWSLGAPR